MGLFSGSACQGFLVLARSLLGVYPAGAPAPRSVLEAVGKSPVGLGQGCWVGQVPGPPNPSATGCVPLTCSPVDLHLMSGAWH